MLFRGHPELIEEYAIFIPPGHTIDIPADPQGNILLRMPTGTAEITRDGAVVNETHIEVPEPQGEEVKSPALPEQEKRLLDTLRARIVGTEEQEEYEALIKSFEANLIISPEQRKVCRAKILPMTFQLTSSKRPHSMLARAVSSWRSSRGF